MWKYGNSAKSYSMMRSTYYFKFIYCAKSSMKLNIWSNHYNTNIHGKCIYGLTNIDSYTVFMSE